MTFMSHLKPAWHLERIQALRDGRNIVPTHLQLIISDLCNQNCHFCAYRIDGGFSTELFWDGDNRNPIRFMPTSKAKEIIHDYAEMGGKAVEFTGGGEPTVHKDHLEIIGYAQDLGLSTGLVTNGVLLRNHSVIQYLDWIRISLDAGTPETYEKIRESKAWSKVMNSLNMVSNFSVPKVGVGFVVTRENYCEIGKALEIVKGANIPYMRVSAMFSNDGSDYYDGIDVEIPDDPAIVNFFHDRIDDLDQGRPDYDFCGYQQFVLYIGADLQIYTCCTNAYTTHGKIGDLTDGTFRKWLGSKDRRSFKAKSCHHCQFNQKNKLINYMVDSKPEHVDFV